MTDLDKRAAYLLRTPIREPEQVPAPIMLKNSNENGQRVAAKEIGEELVELRDRLLQFAGNTVCFPPVEEDFRGYFGTWTIVAWR